MRQHLLRHLLSNHSLLLLQRLGRARQDPVAAHATKVSDDAMADETTPVIVVARTQVRVGNATTIVAIVTTAIEAQVVQVVKVASEAQVLKVASEVKAAFERKVAVMVVATEAVLASDLHAAAVVTDHVAKAGRTRVVGLSKAPTGAPTPTGAPIRVPGRIRLRVLTRAAVSTEAAAASRAHVPIRVVASIKAPGVISLRVRINHPALIRAKAPFETTSVTAR
jgi:hypothetical protein